MGSFGYIFSKICTRGEAEMKLYLIKLTNNCNMLCKMCGQRIRNERYNKSNLNFDKIINFFDADIEGDNVCLWGGEPLLYNQLIEVVTFFKSKGCQVGIITNGYYLEKYVQDLIDLKIDYITISIDGPREIHNKIRGIEDAYEVAVRNCKMIIAEKQRMGIKHHLHININYTIQEENINYMFDFSRQIEQLGCQSVTFNFPILNNEEMCEKMNSDINNPFGACLSSWKGYIEKEIHIDCEELSKICNRINKEIASNTFEVRWSTGAMPLSFFYINKYFYQLEEYLYGSKDYCLCNLASSTIAIEPNGDIVLCPDYPDTIIGNISDVKLSMYNIMDEKKKIFQHYPTLPMCLRCCHVKTSQ